MGEELFPCIACRHNKRSLFTAGTANILQLALCVVWEAQCHHLYVKTRRLPLVSCCARPLLMYCSGRLQTESRAFRFYKSSTFSGFSPFIIIDIYGPQEIMNELSLSILRKSMESGVTLNKGDHVVCFDQIWPSFKNNFAT